MGFKVAQRYIEPFKISALKNDVHYVKWFKESSGMLLLGYFCIYIFTDLENKVWSLVRLLFTVQCILEPTYARSNNRTNTKLNSFECNFHILTSDIFYGSTQKQNVNVSLYLKPVLLFRFRSCIVRIQSLRIRRSRFRLWPR